MNVPTLKGYKKPQKLKYNFFILGIIGFILQIISLIFFSFVKFWVEHGYIPNKLSGSISFGSLGSFLILLSAIVSLHELTHGITFQILGYKVKYGIRFPVAYAMAHKQFIKSRDYFIVALAPLFILDLLAIGLFFIKIPFLSNLALFTLVVNTSGAVGDIWMAFKICTYPKNTLFYDYSPVENYVYLKSETAFFK